MLSHTHNVKQKTRIVTTPLCYSSQGGNGNIGLSSQNVVTSSVMTNGTSHNRTTSKTAPARLEGFDDDEEEDNALFKVLQRNKTQNPLTLLF